MGNRSGISFTKSGINFPLYLYIFLKSWINSINIFEDRQTTKKMRPTKLFIILFYLAITGSSIARSEKVIINGYVKDASNGESLIGANITIASLNTGTVTNAYGFYSFLVPKGDSITIVYSFIGYKSETRRILPTKNMRLSVNLQPSPVSINDVIISAHKQNENIELNQMSVLSIPVKTINLMPAIMGEPDILKSVQLLPGVQSGAEGTTGFYVRGGNADQNLILLDGATLYNPNHLFGLLSTFNSRAVNNVKMIKGGFPAQYGGRLSSILDVSLKEGNNKNFKIDGGLGLITSRLTIQGPIIKDKASFIISARRTYFDLIMKLLSGLSKNDYYFYDYNAKFNYQFSEKDRVYLSLFSDLDNASYIDASSLNYAFKIGNTTGTLRWNHLFSDNLFSNTSLIYNSYKMDLRNIQGNYYSQFYSEIKDFTAKTDFDLFLNNQTLKFGLSFTNHTIVPTGTSGQIPKGGAISSLNTDIIQKKQAREAGAYLNDEINITNRLGLNLGVRLSYFQNQAAKYYGAEPRATFKYTLSTQSSLKASYTVMNQYLHLVPSSTASFPTDIWLPSSNLVKPQRSEQTALGYFLNLDGNKIQSSLEVYYKTMQNQVAFKEGTHLIEQTDIDKQLVFGKGWSYGAELMIKKLGGKLSGWLAYTLSWTNQKFDKLNFGRTFPFKYDRRHNLSLVGIYKLNDHWTLSGNFVFRTGNAITLPEGRVSVYEGGDLYNGVFDVYTTRNNYRLQSYHRLDISASYKHYFTLFGKDIEGELVLSVYNVYSRLNPYFVYLDVDSKTKTPIAKQVSLLPIIPSISYNFKF